MINLIPGKLYRANHELWSLDLSTRNAVLVDKGTVLLFVDEPVGRSPMGYVCEFIHATGDVISLHRTDVQSFLKGPLSQP